METLRDLNRHKAAGTLHYFVPLRLKKWMQDNTSVSPSSVSEFDWWDQAEVQISKPEQGLVESEKLMVTATPCQHFSGRGLFDRQHSLWSSWAVQRISREGKVVGSVWFGGDTGYQSQPVKGVDDRTLPFCPAFKEIGNKLGPFDLGVSIGWPQPIVY